MINKNDCMTVLVELEKSRGVNINKYLTKLLMASEPPLEVLKFISDNHGSDITNFYEMLRKNYNNKRSPLYINIVREITDPNDVLTTLTSLLTQILLYSRKLEANRDIFIREARAEEITRVLNNYFKNDDLEKCISLLRLIKSDLMVLEYVAGRRELQA